MWVCLFDERRRRDPAPAHRAHARRLARRVPGVPVGQRYGFRADGPWDPSTGRASTRRSCCSTPTPARSAATVDAGPRRCCRTTSATRRAQHARLRAARCRGRSSCTTTFDWEGDRQLRTRWRDTVIYELHVKGFTKLHDRSPSTCAARTPGWQPDRDRYLKDLGVTAVELLPVHHFFTEPARGRARAGQLLGLQLASASSRRTRRTPPPATAASRSPSSSRW